MNLAREAGIHFVAAGHYATERLGVVSNIRISKVLNNRNHFIQLIIYNKYGP